MLVFVHLTNGVLVALVSMVFGMPLVLAGVGFVVQL